MPQLLPLVSRPCDLYAGLEVWLTALTLTLKTWKVPFVSGWYQPTALGKLRKLQANLAYMVRLCP